MISCHRSDKLHKLFVFFFCRLALLGLFWGSLGALLGRSWAFLGPLGGLWGSLGSLLELSWGSLGLFGGSLGLSWTTFGQNYAEKSGLVILAPLCCETSTFEGLRRPSWSHLGSKVAPKGGQDSQSGPKYGFPAAKVGPAGGATQRDPAAN